MDRNSYLEAISKHTLCFLELRGRERQAGVFIFPHLLQLQSSQIILQYSGKLFPLEQPRNCLTQGE